MQQLARLPVRRPRHSQQVTLPGKLPANRVRSFPRSFDQHSECLRFGRAAVSVGDAWTALTVVVRLLCHRSTFPVVVGDLDLGLVKRCLMPFS